MAKPKSFDTVEREALLIGYGTLLDRVEAELQGDTSIKAVLMFQKADLVKRIKAVREADSK